MKHPLLTYIEKSPGETVSAFCIRADISRMTFWRLTNDKGEYSTSLLKRVSEATGGKVSFMALVKRLAQREAA
jgi:hypothetical protein